MGWISGQWPDDMIGDEALDATGAYLDELGRIYREVHQRLPRASELQELLVTVLRAAPGDYLTDMDDTAITAVVVSVQPRGSDA